MNPARLAPLLALAVLLPPAGCGKWGKGGDDKKQSQDDQGPPLVRVTALKRVTLDRVLEISGTVQPMTSVMVNPRIEDAEILELKADVGDRVKEGDVLAVFDPTDANMTLDDTKVAQAEAVVRLKDAEVALKELESQKRAQELTLEQAQKSLDRAEAQAEKGAISQESLDTFQYKREQEVAQKERLGIQIEKAQVAVELARKSLDKAGLVRARAERKLSWAKLRAPITGIVAKRQATIGQQTLFTSLARESLFEIFDPASLFIMTQVTQRDLPNIRVGQPVEIRSDACPGVTFEGKIAVVSPVVDATAGTIPVRISIADNGRLKPGLFVSGRIVVEAKPDALVVPKKAVLYERERPYVMKIVGAGADQTVARVFFREGLTGKDEVEALVDEPGALKDTDRIVLVGHDRLRDGDAVTIEKAAESAASRTASAADGG